MAGSTFRSPANHHAPAEARTSGASSKSLSLGYQDNPPTAGLSPTLSDPEKGGPQVAAPPAPRVRRVEQQHAVPVQRDIGNVSPDWENGKDEQRQTQEAVKCVGFLRDML